MRWINKKTVLIALALFIAYYAYGRFFGGGWHGGMPGGAMPVSVAEVTERDVQQWQEFAGRLIAVDRAEIRPRVSGTIEQVHFEEGQWVEKGQLLFTIDQKPYAANLQAAQARATLAEAELERAKMLIAEKAIPQRDYDQRKNAAEVARADLIRAKLDYDYTLIKAPVAGRVSRAEITVGNLVDAGGSAPVLTSVVSNKPIYADFDIDEQSYLNYLASTGGDRTKLNDIPVFLGLGNETDAPHAGRVQSFDNQLDMRSSTLRIRAVFPNEDGALVPGMFARVRLGTASTGKSVLIADRAVGTDQNKKFAYVVGSDNTIAYREIKIGGSSDGLRIVTDGLKPGEKVVVSSFMMLRPGMPVTPEVEGEKEKVSGSGLQAPEKETTLPVPEAQSPESKTQP